MPSSASPALGEIADRSLHASETSFALTLEKLANQLQPGFVAFADYQGSKFNPSLGDKE